MHHLINSYLLIELYEQRFPNDAAIIFETLADNWEYFLDSADVNILESFWKSLKTLIPNQTFKVYCELYGAF